MKAIDSNLLVYASLAEHPAVTACEEYIGECPEWLTNVVNLLRIHRWMEQRDAPLAAEFYSVTQSLSRLA